MIEQTDLSNDTSHDVKRLGGVARLLIVVATVLAVGFVSLGIVELVRHGKSASEVASLYGFSVADYRAHGAHDLRPAPNITGPDLQGKPLSLSTYRGKVIVLNLWGSWCGPCRKEEPYLVQLSKQYASRGVQFLGIDLKDQHAAAEAFRDEFHVTYPSFFDPSGELASKLEVVAAPTTFVIDRRFNIFFRFTGAIDRQLLENALLSTLDEK